MSQSINLLHELVPLLVASGSVFLSSVAIYFGIRYFAYRRSFPLPHKFDFLWIVVTLLVMYISCSSYPPLEGTLSPKLQTGIIFLTFLLSCYLAIFILDQFIVEYFLVSVLKLYVAPPLRKVAVLFVIAITVLIGFQKIFSVNPWAVYAPTSILSLGIGIALKDAFQMFFAGVALCRIVRIGDWIRIGDKEGAVVDINWARTVLRTWEGAHLFIPNNELQTQMFYSFDYADPRQRCRLEIGAAYGAPPQKVKRVLLGCVQNVEGIALSPPPEVLLVNYGDSSILYALTFWVSRYSRWREIQSEVATRIWYAFKRENIEIPFPIRTVHMVPKPGSSSEEVQPASLLNQIDLFKVLAPEERRIVQDRLKRETYLTGECVVREGEPGSSFYIVLKGKLEVLRNVQDAPILIGELSTGQFFGELSLLTGEPRTATVRSQGDSELLRLDKADFQEILQRHPGLAEGLADVVSHRQAKLVEHGGKPADRPDLPAQPGKLSRKIREFFNLS